MNGKKARLLIPLLPLFVPLLAEARELGYVMPGVEYVFFFLVLVVTAVFALGFRTGFRTWPQASTLSGLVANGLAVGLVLFVLACLVAFYS
jgi:hypothetical protein